MFVGEDVGNNVGIVLRNGHVFGIATVYIPAGRSKLRAEILIRAT